MNLLAIETSTSLASVALSCNGVLFFEEKTALKDHATSLLPMIESLFKDAACEFGDLDGIVFGQGPGSFTGLRIACSVAKGLAYAHSLPLFAVSSLDAIAYQARIDLTADVDILAMIDARMRQVYWAHFMQNDRSAEPYVSDASAVTCASDRPLCLAGVGFEDYREALPRSIQEVLVIQRVISPHATTMIQFVKDTKPLPIDIALAEPVYVRNQVTSGEPRG